MTDELRIDALLPPEMARRAEYIGVRKAEAPVLTTFILAVLAGAFIALGAVFATTIAAGSTTLPYGVAKLLIGLGFCLGLVLVIVGGAELFTGNNLIVMAWASGKVSTRALLWIWAIVYAGNFVGSVGTAIMIFFSRQYLFSGGAVGATALGIATGKVGLGWIQAVFLGTLCNILVCLAVWLTFSARSTIDKIAAIIFPITAFVAAGFEHSIANMYFIPIGLLIKNFDPTFVATLGLDVSGLTWSTFLLKNLLPVTLGNIIGGSLFVAAVYWAVFLRQTQTES
ncbi:MAG: formate transporter FocA [Anaerolineae bacterium SM23_ 63]|nr:MAG: formate transporter FocA [Anaerolineae bacterium SM23_ 63]HEY46304.1 formate transporter FocA [Anaerolineae bacterium]